MLSYIDLPSWLMGAEVMDVPLSFLLKEAKSANRLKSADGTQETAPPRGTTWIAHALIAAMISSPGWRAISWHDCLVTRALRGKPQSSVTRTTAPSRSSDWMRPIRWLRALLWVGEVFFSKTTSSAWMQT